MQKLMTAGQALDWMIANELRDLADSDGDLWRRCRGTVQCLGVDGLWSAEDIGQVFESLRWYIPERKLPKLPEGSLYVLDNGLQRVECDDGYCFFLAQSEKHAAIFRALAEEFETRPK